MSNINSGKGRFWEFVSQCDKCNSNWLSDLEGTGLPFCYIKHDNDYYTSSDDDCEHAIGELKPAHYHVLVAWSSPTTFKNANALKEALGFIRIQRKFSIGGAYDYLIHRHNADKYHYDITQVQHFNGFNIADYSSLTDTEIAEMATDILRDIENYHITEISHLNLLYSAIDLDKFNFVRNRSNFFKNHITSNRHSGGNGIEYVKKLINDYDLELRGSLLSDES